MVASHAKFLSKMLMRKVVSSNMLKIHPGEYIENGADWVVEIIYLAQRILHFNSPEISMSFPWPRDLNVQLYIIP